MRNDKKQDGPPLNPKSKKLLKTLAIITGAIILLIILLEIFIFVPRYNEELARYSIAVDSAASNGDKFGKITIDCNLQEDKKCAEELTVSGTYTKGDWLNAALFFGSSKRPVIDSNSFKIITEQDITVNTVGQNPPPEILKIYFGDQNGGKPYYVYELTIYRKLSDQDNAKLHRILEEEAAKKAEEERIAAEKKAEEERIANEKKAEEERIADEKKAAEERVANEKKATKEAADKVKAAEKETGTAGSTYVTPAPQPSTATNCANGTYVNAAGNTVCSPSSSNTGGATAICKDGTYSYSQNRRGTCSGHGGVKEWL